jgi:hypothetical protein
MTAFRQSVCWPDAETPRYFKRRRKKRPVTPFVLEYTFRRTIRFP